MSQGLTYFVDLVYCIDATGSMGPVIESVKSRAVAFPEDLLKQMEEKGKGVTQLRIRVIAYRDIHHDSTPFIASEFFTMPDQADSFAKFVSGITADGGGDEPESGLEALAIAMHSDWAQGADKHRHAIIVWTDASAHHIERSEGKVPAQYADQVPKSFDELYDLWECESQTTPISLMRSARRILVFAPETYPWSIIGSDWDGALFFPSQAGKGLKEFEYEEMVAVVAESV